ncbi:SAM-dependent methyltransferase [Erythrobacter longus]|uniref:SAM-dependent methyltransferase n=1 Tax=Erythrobacter longus TaxID=1044 RepID=A0A074MGB5_ERYLO|nr:DUF938 domain-containing protein [Erythrobacter longus]KEO90893.1 SAM-dependent methyltransferase [Erythrobacter longus]
MKKHAPATLRNREAIARVLSEELPKKGMVLEVASGSGEHVVFFAQAFPALTWQPSDLEVAALNSIRAYTQEYTGNNIRDPIEVDAQLPKAWALPPEIAAALCINMIHITAYASCTGLFEGTARAAAQSESAKGFPLILYGPFFEQGVGPAESNLAFDLSLKARNPSWGIRHVEEIDMTARAHGFERTARYEMPANNLMLIYRFG